MSLHSFVVRRFRPKRTWFRLQRKILFPYRICPRRSSCSEYCCPPQNSSTFFVGLHSQYGRNTCLPLDADRQSPYRGHAGPVHRCVYKVKFFVQGFVSAQTFSILAMRVMFSFSALHRCRGILVSTIGGSCLPCPGTSIESIEPSPSSSCCCQHRQHGRMSQ